MASPACQDQTRQGSFSVNAITQRHCVLSIGETGSHQHSYLHGTRESLWWPTRMKADVSRLHLFQMRSDQFGKARSPSFPF